MLESPVRSRSDSTSKAIATIGDGNLKLTSHRLDYEEADILCPPVSATATIVKQGEGDNTTIHYSSDESEEEDERLDDEESTRQGGKCKTNRHNFGSWTRSRGRHHRPISFRKFIPFDRTIFSWLDSRIQFDPTPSTETPLDDYLDPSTTLPPSPNLDELSIVVPHPPLPPWEDIPPYQRSRGYNDQPAYTDGFEEFLLLQRDPRSTIDLDDCLEIRLALTSSRGGTGVMGDWSLGIEKDNEGFDAEEDKGLFLRYFADVVSMEGMMRQIPPFPLGQGQTLTYPLDPWINRLRLESQVSFALPVCTVPIPASPPTSNDRQVRIRTQEIARLAECLLTNKPFLMM
ncbi:Hypothetical Protein CGB_M2060C [Cryptococcus gattii WM276]|uniref:Uncharacterized protein n=2 Tax=Cryptococcus gattii TaxID=37769 RepID=E6RFA5_CRYGW|nr:Hypothetical Protein CGB_M2060C [Cryptococcus gattii WM276]ADV25555.1 Hypothetical Protein CGB_M2060C [Cryptococcus gattii WM276]KIR78918.1 hypothetical protein I306_04128 [Cryptococcus gattii EJB2]